MRKNRLPARRPRWYDALVFAALVWACFAAGLAVTTTVQEEWSGTTTVVEQPETKQAGGICTVDEDKASGLVLCPMDVVR